MALGRVYKVSGGQSIAANATETQLVITAPSNRVVRLRRVAFGQDGHNNSETILLEMLRATAAGSGGAAPTPQPVQVNQGAAGSTIGDGPTTEPTYASEEPYLQIAVNTALGRDYVFDPESAPIVPPSGIAGIRVVNRTGNTAISSPRCELEFEEIG
jgi:hypothetical protein